MRLIRDRNLSNTSLQHIPKVPKRKVLPLRLPNPFRIVLTPQVEVLNSCALLFTALWWEAVEITHILHKDPRASLLGIEKDPLWR